MPWNRQDRRKWEDWCTTDIKHDRATGLYSVVLLAGWPTYSKRAVLESGLLYSEAAIIEMEYEELLNWRNTMAIEGGI